MNQVKAVIWDLDETFWGGVLSEGAITYRRRHHEIVIELSRRGIVNSISSKNDFSAARACLQEHGIWDYFVFPKIDWSPKGPLIAELLAELQLRAENVLFIDDNHMNRAEAEYFSPGLQTAGPELIGEMLALKACRGKDDSDLSRLQQYRLLEKKTLDRKKTGSTNEDFLRSSDIRVETLRDCVAEAPRILELVNRTNQLNYTKKRLTGQQLQQLLARDDLQAGYVRVSDRYGDYGVCGFYALAAGRLEHFLFSCRILNMGVEHWLYRKLGCPALEVSGDVATPLSADYVPDWIAEGDLQPRPSGGRAPREARARLRIMVKGCCDLLQTKNYLIKGSLVDAETNYVSKKGTMVRNSHTEILRRSHAGVLDAYGEVIDRVQFLDREAFVTKFFDAQHDVYIYSALEDYTRGLYRYRDTDFVVPFDDFLLDATDPDNWSVHLKRNDKHRLDRPFLEWFSGRFAFSGAISAERFHENITWLAGRFPPQKLLIILNGSEVDYTPNPEQERWRHHRRMNSVLAEAVQGHDNVVVCDVRDFLETPADHRNNIRHYSRVIYYQIAQRINAVLEERCDVSVGFLEKQWNAFKIGKKVARIAVKEKLGKAFRDMLAAR